ncbi:MAG TPA: zinc-binding dehydrogenase [Chthonomonadaceae bacterium]|nr:zinc-binding dehydrogenase [Chthonomonadaceae bacterium]
MGTHRIVVADPGVPERLVFREAPIPTPAAHEALVKVAAVSLNRGEVRRAMSTNTAFSPGWDLAGVVEQGAPDGSGPKAGARVVGIARSGAWAQYIALPTNQLAVLPDAVTFAQAATLPVAGLTAMHALWKGGFLLERSVLITGATGGVGDFAIQLGRLVGANIVASVRKPDQAAFVREIGAQRVAIGDDLSDARQYGPFALVIDSVGGKTLGDALAMLEEGGKVVSLGTSAGSQVTFDASHFYGTGMVSLYGMMLFDELRTVESATHGLARLANLIAQGKLNPRISVEADWTQVANVAQQLMDRRYPGKAVLQITG